MDSVIEDPGFASGLSSLRICLSVCPWPGSPPCSSSLLPRQGTPTPDKDLWAQKFCTGMAQLKAPLYLLMGGSATNSCTSRSCCFILHLCAAPLSLTPAPGAQPRTFQLSQSWDVTPCLGAPARFRTRPCTTCPEEPPPPPVRPPGAGILQGPLLLCPRALPASPW